MSDSTRRAEALMDRLRMIVGRRHVLGGHARTRAFREGYRIGAGAALCVVRPGSLRELWTTAQACVRADVIIIMQAANTGLTGGSTPCGTYDRPVIIISTLRINRVIPLDGGRQAVCLAGATLTGLERALARFGRTPHSVIGSSCLGASVVGGICNNSGGALVERGPAFTRHALYGRIAADGALVLVNELGFATADPERLIDDLDAGIAAAPMSAGPESDAQSPADHAGYAAHVRAIGESTPARYNADPRCLHGASGSAGKVIVLAVRVQSFPAPARTRTFCLSTDDPDALGGLRRRLLSQHSHLPVSSEYLHRDAARLAASHGNDVCLAVGLFGDSAMPQIFAAKRALDRWCGALSARSASPGDQLLQWMGARAPHPLPPDVRRQVGEHEHSLLLTVADPGIAEFEGAVPDIEGHGVIVRACSAREAAALRRLRFAAAGAVIRYATVEGDAGPLVAIDCALPRNLREWHLRLPADLAAQVLHDVRYGHFLCHVFHLDFVLRPGADAEGFEHGLLRFLEGIGAQCPAEHNFGHHYRAPEHLVRFYRQLDPTNTLNPGVGQTSRRRNWA